MLEQMIRDGIPLALDTRIDYAQAITEATILTADHPGLMAQLAGAIALAGGDIVNARIFTFANGLALDSFNVQSAYHSQAFDTDDKLARLAIMVKRVLSGEIQPATELAHRKRPLPARTRIFAVPLRVIIDNRASATHTIIETNGQDRPGLLYALTQAVTDLQLQISTAKISTYGNKAIDVFYVKDAGGLKITDERKVQDIREHLLRALDDQPESADKP